MNPFDPKLLSGALDDSLFPVLDELVEYFAPEAPFLTFNSPGAARVLSLYGRTVLASRDHGTDPFDGFREAGVELRVAGPEDPMVFPPGRFGLVHARWTSLSGSTVANLTRWLKKDGILLIEAPDDYPARNLPRGPYQAVAEAVADRLNLPATVHLPGLLIRHGLADVGCRHQPPSKGGFHHIFDALVSQGFPWPDVDDADLGDWPHDPVAATPAFTNVLVWGRKTTR